MKKQPDIIQDFDTQKTFRTPFVLAIGMFDGLHRGHQRVLNKCLKLAGKLNAHAAVLTFNPHPSSVIKMPHPPAKMIFDINTRAAMFANAGVKKVFVKKFDLEFATKTPQEFAEILMLKFPNLRGIVTGENFLFGKNASGNAESLAKICALKGWNYSAVKRLKSGANRISSTRLRTALSKGEMGVYKRLSGAYYEGSGKVIGGKKLGRKLGFPTLNVPWNQDCKPPYGVYAVEVESADGKVSQAVASYGTSPSTGTETQPLIEANILGDTKLNAGDFVKIRFLKFFRQQKKFDSLDALKAQIAKDKNAAEKFFAKKR